MAGREAAIKSLLESFDGSVGREVKERVRLKSDGTPRTLNSFNSELSVIRCEVYKRFEPTIDDSLREIAQSADARLARDINAFLAATLRDKVRIQRARAGSMHARAPEGPNFEGVTRSAADSQLQRGDSGLFCHPKYPVGCEYRDLACFDANFDATSLVT